MYEKQQGADKYALAIHAIRHSAVPRDAVAEILDVERALETGCEEAAERSDKRREAGHDEQVELVRRVWDSRNWSSELQKSSQPGKLILRRKSHLRAWKARPLRGPTSPIHAIRRLGLACSAHR